MEGSKEKISKGGELSMLEKRTSNGGHVVITVASEETPKVSVSKDHETFTPIQSRPNSPLQESNVGTGGYVKSVSSISCPSPETLRCNPSPNRTPPKPPRIPTANENLTRRKSLTRSVYSKPKARYEPPYPVDPTLFEESNLPLQEQMTTISPYRSSLDRGSPNNKSNSSARTKSIKEKLQSILSSRGHATDEENHETFYKTIEVDNKRHRKVKPKVVLEWVAFVCILGTLVASLTVEKLEKTMIWELELWKWCVLVMVIFCGLLVTKWFMHFVVFMIEKNFLLQKKVLYFVHGLKQSVQAFIWIGLVLLAWALLFDQGDNRTKKATKILNCITWTLVSLLIGSFLWLLKTLLLKILAANTNVNRFFDRIQESVFHQYVLQTLSGPPLVQEAERVGRTPSTGQLSVKNTKKGKEAKDKKVIDMGQVHQMKREKVSAWTMKVLIDAVTNSGLSTISSTLDESLANAADQPTDKEITDEREATNVARQIFKKVAHDPKYIEEDDLLKYMIKEEVDLFFPLIEGSDTGKIDLKAFSEWVVKVYNGRKALAHSLTDTKTAVKQLNKLVAMIVVVVTIIIWLLLMEIATTKVLVFLSSQLVLAAFMFGNTCKTIFEAIIFVFVMHPFDVGDRCVIDGVPLLVEEMNILSTVFLKLDYEKVFYPNSVLATKAISNYYRSPNMGDVVEFSIDFGTPVDKIGLLKQKIEDYLKNNPQHWHPNHNFVVKEIENVNKLKMALYCTHTINFQEYGEKLKRKTELVIAIKKIFEELGIKYYLLPQKIHLHDNRSESTNVNNGQGS